MLSFALHRHDDFSCRTSRLCMQQPYAYCGLADENTEAVIIEEYRPTPIINSYGHLMFIGDEKSCVHFFYVNKIKRVKDELGIGMYSKINLKFNEYVVDQGNANRNKCSIQYAAVCGICGTHCQKMLWSEHRHVWNAKW